MCQISMSHSWRETYIKITEILDTEYRQVDAIKQIYLLALSLILFSMLSFSNQLSEKGDCYKMKEFRRPTLAVIRENGDPLVTTALPLPDDDKLNNNQSNSPIAIDNTVSLNNNPVADDISLAPESDSDLAHLKETATRLHLTTRRPSYVAWRAKYIEKPNLLTHEDLAKGDFVDDSFTAERRQRIDQAIEWLKNELQAMRSQDQDLARQLLCIRDDIHKLKLQWSCEEHQDMLDDFQMDMEELHELHEICDLPLEIVNNNPFKHIGLTRMNLSRRRFSMC